MSGKYDIDMLADACRRGDVATVRACLAKGVNVNSNKHTVYGYTPLMAAVRHNQLEIVRILLARDDLAIADNYCSFTALHDACDFGKADCIALLGQDRRMTRQIINMKTNNGQTALMKAVLWGNLSCVEMMSELEGVDWETKNNTGHSLEDIAR